MRVCVFGAGSLGSALGALLASRNEVFLIARKVHVDAIRRKGLRLIGSRRRVTHLEARETVKGVPTPDLLIIATKAYDTGSAVDACRPMVSESTRVLTLQNGLGNLELLRAWKGRSAFGGTTTMGAVLESPGVVRISGMGHTVIGADLDQTGASWVASLFDECGIPVRVSRDTNGEMWAKAVVNACINPITSILRVPNGALLESKGVTALMDGVCAECEEVASAAGIALPKPAMRARARAVARDTSRNRSSMLRDVELGRRTEIMQINGKFSEFGRGTGVATPLNNALVAMVEALAPACPEKG
jgi:2-dehydropantoate 2-reductase